MRRSRNCDRFGFYTLFSRGESSTVAEHIYTYTKPTNKKDLEKACEALSKSGVIAYPTDVNWALGCDATQVKAVKKLLALKPDHPKDKPFSLLCESLAMISSIAFLGNGAYRILRKALPGPYTILLKPQKKLARQIHDKRKTVGIRVPDSPLLLDLLEMYGKPLVTSSLVFEDKKFSYGYEVDEVYGHGLDVILDLGQEMEARQTSVVDMTEEPPQVIREGLGSIDFFR